MRCWIQLKNLNFYGFLIIDYWRIFYFFLGTKRALRLFPWLFDRDRMFERLLIWNLELYRLCFCFIEYWWNCLEKKLWTSFGQLDRRIEFFWFCWSIVEGVFRPRNGAVKVSSNRIFAHQTKFKNLILQKHWNWRIQLQKNFIFVFCWFAYWRNLEQLKLFKPTPFVS